MSFPTELPKDALGTLLHFKEKDTATLALAAYELVGFGLYLGFGNVKYPTGLDFETLSKIAEGADLVAKIQAKAKALKEKGTSNWLIILQLLAEFGPVILKLIESIRELLKNKE